ncbi:MAG: zf-HC2 domain-containing protein [Chloroflexota bacterium]
MSTSLSEQDFIQLNAYLDGELSGREREAFELRLANDAGLQHELQTLQVTVSLLGMAERVPVPRNFTLDPAVYGRPARRSGLSGLWPVLSTAGAALSTLLVCVGLVLSLTSKGALTAPAAAPMAEEVFSAQATQLEAPAAPPLEEPAEEATALEEAQEEAPMAMEAAPTEEAEAAAAEEEMAAEQALQAEMAEPGMPPTPEAAGGGGEPPVEEPATEEPAADVAEGEAVLSPTPTPTSLASLPPSPTIGADDAGSRAADEGRNGAEVGLAPPLPEIAGQRAVSDMTAQAAAQAAAVGTGARTPQYGAAPLPILLLVVGGVGLVVSLVGLIASRRRR